jgi:hypothetical protein
MQTGDFTPKKLNLYWALALESQPLADVAECPAMNRALAFCDYELPFWRAILLISASSGRGRR